MAFQVQGFTGPGGGPPATGMQLRLRADDIAAADGSSVASWSDASPVGIPAFTAAGAAQPTLLYAGGHGHHAVVFNGTTNRMTTTGTGLNVFRNRSAAMVFVVYSTPTLLTGAETILSWTTPAGSNRVAVNARDTADLLGTMGAGWRTVDADTGQSVRGLQLKAQSTPQMISARYDYANASLYLYQDGLPTGLSNSYHAAGSTSDTASAAGVIGSHGNGTEFFYGGILEILAYSVADLGTLNAVHAYLAATYGIGQYEGGGTPVVTVTLPAAGVRYPFTGTAVTTAVTATRPAAGTSNFVPTGVADPWGGYWPGPTNTGVPAGTVLTNYTGPTTITVNGTTVDSKTISGGIDIQADNVTFTKCSFTGGSIWLILNDNAGTNLQIIDCEFDGADDAGNDASVNGSDYLILRCNIHNSGDGLKAMSGVTIQDCYIHDLYIIADSHNDGVQCLGTTSLNIIHNYMWVADGATSCIILSTGSASDMRNILIQHNLFAGGAFTVYGGYQAGADDISKVSNIQILNNRFSTIVFPNCGAFGPMTSVSSPVVLSDNLYWDGPKAGQSV